MKSLADDGQLWIIPLGGLGRIGGNMMVYETAKDLIVVDCGVLFPDHTTPGVNYIIPDISYVLKRKHKLRGYVITHGHEDHIGALPYVLPVLPAPVYATRFTEALLQSKLAEYPDLQPDIRTMVDSKTFTLGDDFVIEPLAVTHSIPDSVALAIDTPVGVLVHTGDFKIDPTPPDGRVTDLAALAAYGKRGITMLLSDSTNAEKSGHTHSEKDVAEAILQCVKQAPHRVFLTTFASHMQRIQAVLDAAQQTGRQVITFGRSIQQNIEIGLNQGFLKAPRSILSDTNQFNTLPRNKVVIIASGSQGEPFGAMSRLAQDQLPPLTIEAGDRVLLSSRRIPGNERAIGTMVNNLYRLGAEVITPQMAAIHASGHGFNDEQRTMITLCKPHFFVPLHGEMSHMKQHAALAVQAGVLEEHAQVIEDGQPLLISRVAGRLSVERQPPVHAGITFVDGSMIGDVDAEVLQQRLALSEHGVVTCVVVLGTKGQLLLPPRLVLRGVYKDTEHPKLVAKAVHDVQQCVQAIAQDKPVHDKQESIRGTLRRFFKRELGRKPAIFPVVISLRSCGCE